MLKDRVLSLFDYCYDRCPLLTSVALTFPVTALIISAGVGLQCSGVIKTDKPTRIDRIEKRLDAIERDKAVIKGVTTAGHTKPINR